jgi:hypothetical protein
MMSLLSPAVLVIMNNFWIINISKRFIPRGNILMLYLFLTYEEYN